MLAIRYANPFLILDQFVSTMQLYQFTVEILNTIAEEKVRENRWQFYLHKVWSNMSFGDYEKECERMQEANQSQHMTHEKIGDVIKQSKEMLTEFKFE